VWWWLSVALAAPAVNVPVVDGVRVDGILDEAAWAEASPVSTFSRFVPAQGGAPDEQIEVRVVQDDAALYVGVRVVGTRAPVRARSSPREVIDSDDQIGIYLDPFHDARQGFIFYLNPLGVQQDLRYDNGDWSMAWDTVLRSRGRVDADGHGFTLEVAIPFRSLKYPSVRGRQDWGVMFTRKVPAEGAKYGFPSLARNHPRLFQQAATLAGVLPPAQGSGVEIIPGAAVRVEQQRGASGALTWTPLDPWWQTFRPQLDARVGLGTNFGLVTAINPDFSQVESDITPVVLNRRFAWRFPEQRPLFTEGANYFEDDAATLYTRSIQEPLYGVKVQGREGGWSVGVLHALDRAPLPTFHERGTPGFEASDVEGRWAFNTVLRIRRDLPNAGQVGVTFADKRLATAGLTRDDGRPAPSASADHFGVDVTVPVARRWTVGARHDQSLTSHDGALLGGTRTGVTVTRPRGQGLGVDVDAAFSSVGYRQELGFRPQSGLGEGTLWLDWTAPGRGRVSTVTPAITASFLEEITGEHYWTVGGKTSVLVDGVHDLALQGGYNHRREEVDGDVGVVPGGFVDLVYRGQIGAAVELSPTVGWLRELDFQDRTGTQRIQARLDLTLRPIRPLRIDLLARYLRYDRDEASLTFGDVSHDALLRLRAQWQFTPQLGLRWIESYNLVRRDAVDLAPATFQATSAPTLETNVLFSWLLHPFTAAYVGFAQLDQLGEGGGTTTSRSVFVKAHVWFRP
jgi:hypothetical protein